MRLEVIPPIICAIPQNSFLSTLLNMLFGCFTEKIRFVGVFFRQFWFKRLGFFALFVLGLVASLNRFLDLKLESSRSPTKIAKRIESSGIDSRNRPSITGNA
jgi:hypothetical protein